MFIDYQVFQSDFKASMFIITSVTIIRMINSLVFVLCLFRSFTFG